MKSVNIKEARQEFAKMIETVRRGNPIAITRRGKRVAELIGAKKAAATPLPDLTAFRASITRKKRNAAATIVDLRQAERN